MSSSIQSVSPKPTITSTPMQQCGMISLFFLSSAYKCELYLLLMLRNMRLLPDWSGI